MVDFIVSAVIWTLALYGLIEIVKNIVYLYTYTNMKSDGIYVIVAVKNQEEQVESFLRSVLFRVVYGKEEEIKDLIITDLDSTDDTKDIIKKLEQDYEGIKVVNWKDCKEILDNVNRN